ncbi:MAG TPA: hypothetical protein VJ180_13500, partial [Pyrinomonadaceae bacterium]|nr:hypothetical protein [Pyrinomonadaceae bacterium]
MVPKILPGRLPDASLSKPRGNPPEAQSGFFLRTKLLPPRPTPELLPRPRLTERLLTNLAHPVTL